MNGFVELRALKVVVMISLAVDVNLIGAKARAQSPATNSIPELSPELESAKSRVWHSGLGQGFLSTAQDLGVEMGIAPGMAAFGSCPGS